MKTLELGSLPGSLPASDPLDPLKERRQKVIRQLIQADFQAKWNLLDLEERSPACSESGTILVSRGERADGARLLIQVYHPDPPPSSSIVDILGETRGSQLRPARELADLRRFLRRPGGSLWVAKRPPAGEGFALSASHLEEKAMKTLTFIIPADPALEFRSGCNATPTGTG